MVPCSHLLTALQSQPMAATSLLFLLVRSKVYLYEILKRRRLARSMDIYLMAIGAEESTNPPQFQPMVAMLLSFTPHPTGLLIIPPRGLISLFTTLGSSIL